MSKKASLSCRMKEFFANLSCPECFSKKIVPCEEQTDEKASCEACGCTFEFGSDFKSSIVE